MAITVANVPYRPTGLGQVASLVLSLIDGGHEWLQWAVRDPQVHYQFADESIFVQALQTGLHAMPLVLLPKVGLLVGPIKLMTMTPADLRLLIAAEQDQGWTGGAEIAALLDRYDLLAQDDLAAVRRRLDDMGVAAAPLFQAVGLNAQVALKGLCEEYANVPSSTDRERAAFAVDRARAVPEFCDYYRLHDDCTRALKLDQASADTRRRAACTAIDTLRPLGFQLLDCPKVDGVVPPAKVQVAVREWLLTGRQMGFGRASLFVQQVVRYAGYTGQTGPAAAAIVRAHATAAQRLLGGGVIDQYTLCQDGASCQFIITQQDEQAHLELAPSGLMALTKYDPGSTPDTGYAATPR